jgi:hypothetical protein
MSTEEFMRTMDNVDAMRDAVEITATEKEDAIIDMKWWINE